MDSFGSSPLHAACSRLYFFGVSQLLAEGHPVNQLNLLGETPLMTAISHSNKDPETATYIVSMLLLAGADPNLHKIGNLTPLMLSTLHQNIAIQKLLLDAGADVNAKYTPAALTLIPQGASALAIGLHCKNEFSSITPLLRQKHDHNVLVDAFLLCDAMQQAHIMNHVLRTLEIS